MYSQAVHNDPEVWKEPRSFRPERLEEKYDPYAYLPFINGPRNCLGQNLALLEVYIFPRPSCCLFIICARTASVIPTF